ncbi:hypothetical protein [Anaerocolumna sp. MB42-C2]|uniref:hypothetical protein n=1 Tax=Anaerocolumna sp. MB42-C2 TaxID=3070997 RepID=UPI0027E0B813|nr:hypothetical protein [Anaerocolumna sp. MB42-C2]WMJ85467.1 hypothetical protein RBU59_15460 [Anaerocolumna sp. MB42-C2]
MASFRQRIAIQKQHKEPKKKYDPFKTAKKNYQSETKVYLKRAILMYKTLAAKFKPFSDEEELCRKEVLKYTIDLEILEHGTYEERKEVVKKYGRDIS